MQRDCTQRRFYGSPRIFLWLLRSWTPQENIDKVLPVLDLMMTSGLVTLEKVQVLQYGTQMTPEPVRA
jgi:hypothetical protein